jgi:adenosylhomocysteine nucleosidase
VRRFVRPTLICTAVELEAQALARALELPPMSSLAVPAFGAGDVRVAVVGLGASLIRTRWPSLLAGLADPLVISAGVCGGLDPALAAGDLVLPGSVLGPTGELVNVTPSHHRLAAALAPSAPTGRLITTREVIATPEAKAALFARTGAVAADMESSLILAAAAAAGLPSLVVRAVSDAAHDALPPELIRLVTPEGRLRVAGAVGLIAHPAVVPRAIELRRATRRALGKVAELLAALISGRNPA